MDKRGAEGFMQSALGRIVIAVAFLVIILYIIAVYIMPQLSSPPNVPLA